MIPPVEIVPLAGRIEMKQLTNEEALKLFAGYYGFNSAFEPEGWDRTSVERIVKALECHPFALKLAASSAHDEKRDLKELAKDLEAGPIRGNFLDPVALALSNSLERLPSDASRLILCFAAFGTQEAGRHAVRALASAIGLPAPDNTIHTLVQRSLMTSFSVDIMPKSSDYEASDHERLTIHLLLRKLLMERTQEDTRPREVRDVAHRAIATYYAAYAPRFATGIQQHVLSVDRYNITNALDWAIAHHDWAIDNHNRAIAQSDNELIADLCYGMRLFWHNRWLTDETKKYLPEGIAAADEIARHAGKKDKKEAQRRAADLNLLLGRLYRRRYDLGLAETYFKRDYRERRRLPDKCGEAEVLHQLGQLERIRGNLPRARVYCQKGLAIAVKYNENRQCRRTEGLLLAQLGRVARIRGQFDEAEAYFRRALEIFIEPRVQDRLEAGVALGYLGRIARTRGQLEVAEKLFAESLEKAREMNDQRWEGIIRMQFGRIARTRGQLEVAEGYFREGLALAERIDDPGTKAIALNYLGRIARTRGQLEVAEQYFTESEKIAESVKDRQYQGVDLSYLGRIAHTRGNLAQAQRYFRESLKLAEQVEDVRGQGIQLMRLSEVALDQGNVSDAEKDVTRSIDILRRVPDQRSVGMAWSTLGEICLAKGHLTRAEDGFQRALEIAERLGDRNGESENLYWRAVIAEQRGNAADAEQDYRRSLALATEAEYRLQQGMSLMGLGRLLCVTATSKEEGCEALRASMTIFHELESARHLADASALLERAGCNDSTKQDARQQ